MEKIISGSHMWISKWTYESDSVWSLKALWIQLIVVNDRLHIIWKFKELSYEEEITAEKKTVFTMILLQISLPLFILAGMYKYKTTSSYVQV